VQYRTAKRESAEAVVINVTLTTGDAVALFLLVLVADVLAGFAVWWVFARLTARAEARVRAAELAEDQRARAVYPIDDEEHARPPAVVRLRNVVDKRRSVPPSGGVA
jgi:hypothetical protein